MTLFLSLLCSCVCSLNVHDACFNLLFCNVWVVWPSKISWPPIILKWGSCWPFVSPSCRKLCSAFCLSHSLSLSLSLSLSHTHTHTHNLSLFLRLFFSNCFSAPPSTFPCLSSSFYSSSASSLFSDFIFVSVLISRWSPACCSNSLLWQRLLAWIFSQRQIVFYWPWLSCIAFRSNYDFQPIADRFAFAQWPTAFRLRCSANDRLFCSGSVRAWLQSDFDVHPMTARFALTQCPTAFRLRCSANDGSFCSGSG